MTTKQYCPKEADFELMPYWLRLRVWEVDIRGHDGRNFVKIISLTPTVAIRHTVPDRSEAVICNFWHPGTLMLSPERQSRRHRVASGGRSVAPRWPRVVARLHKSAGGIPLSFRTWSIHRSRGRPGQRFRWSLDGRPRDRATWQWRALCAGTSCGSLATWPKRALRRRRMISDIVSECPDVKNYKWRLQSVWHRMLYSWTHMATVGVKGLMLWWYEHEVCFSVWTQVQWVEWCHSRWTDDDEARSSRVVLRGA